MNFIDTFIEIKLLKSQFYTLILNIVITDFHVGITNRLSKIRQYALKQNVKFYS